jgi:putative ubiquitin-RnfH superfamily antitoxin RatB of RatAB toxin-antitoxin module
MDEPLKVWVCYVTPTDEFLRELALPAGATLEQAIRQSGLLLALPEIDLDSWEVGIFGKKKPRDTVLHAQDRVEVYRPLLADPKEARRRRASHG